MFRTGDKSRKGRGASKGAAATNIDADSSESIKKANGDPAMPQGKGPRAATTANAKANVLDADALSLDELDQVVGGGGGTQTQNSEMPPHEGGYTPPPPPVVHAPTNLPDSINQVEQQVSAHTITGDQAISQIAGIIGAGAAHDIHTQQAAGAEIASLIGRGIIDATTAINDLHTAVTQTQSMTGTEAAGVLAGMVAAQYTTPGESQNISTGAVTEVTNLINAGALDPHEAITAFASLAGTQASFPLISDINTIAQGSHLSALQVATDIGNAVVDGALTGQQAVSVLAGIAMDWTGTTSNMVAAAGHEIADLVANHGVAPADAMAGITSAYYQGELWEPQLPGLLLSAVDANPALADAAATELAGEFSRNPGYATNAANQFESAVRSLGISADTAIDLLLGTAQHGQSGFASQVIVDLVENNTWNMNQAMAAIESHTTSATVDGAVSLLMGLATNGGYASTFAPPAEAALVTMIQNGQIDAAQAANDIAPHLATPVYSYNAGGMVPAVNDPFYGPHTLQMLMSVATAGTSDAVSGVTAALDALITAHNNGTGGCAPLDIVTALANSVGSYSAATANPVLDAAITQQLTGLVSSGAVDANAAIEAISNCIVASSPYTGKVALSNEIVAIAGLANLTPAQVVADVLANPPQNTNASPSVVLGMLAGHGTDWQAAAVTGLLSLVGSSGYPTGDSLVTSLPSYLMAYNVPADNVVGLLAALVGDGTTAVHASAVGAQIASLISSGHIDVAHAITDIHTTLTHNNLGGDAALALLANLALNSTSAQPAVNLEMRALVTGNPPLIPAGHATDVLNALLADAQSANNTALAAVLNSELTMLAASDPAVAIFQGLGNTTSDTDLDTAATQLSTMIASGASTLAHVMNDIDQAYTNGTLTPFQASSLLVDIAAHAPGNMTPQAALAVQVAAGAEFAKILSVSNGAGVAMLPGGSATPNDPPWGSVVGILGLGVGGYLDMNHPNVMTARLTTEGVAAFLAGGLGSSAISEITRTAFEIAATGSVGYGSTFFNMNATLPAPVNGPALTQAFNDIAAAHAMPGPELIRAVFVLTGAYNFNAGQELQNFILNHSVSMTDVNTAITSGAWQVDNAVQVLTSISSGSGVLPEINSLISGGTITAQRLISDLHDGLTGGNMHGQALSASNVADVLGMLAASGDSNALTLVTNELVTDITHGLMPMANVATICTASGATLVDLILGNLGSLNGADAGTLLGQMLSANLTTFDHVFGLTAGTSPALSLDTVANALQWAITYDNTLSTGQVGAAVSAALADGALTAGQAMTLVIDWADTGIGTMATLSGQIMAAAVATGQITADAAMNQLTQNANAMAHTQFGGVGINVPAMTALLNSFVAHTDPASVMAACTEARTLVAYNFFSADQGLSLMAGFANYANAAGLQAIGETFSGMLHNGQGSLYEIQTLLTNAGVTGAHAMSVFAGIAEGAASNGDDTIVSGALAQITALTQPGGATTQDAFTALCGVAGSMAATLHPSLMQAVGAQMQTLVLADLSALAGMGAAITGQTLTSAQAASLLLSMMPNSGDASQGLPAALVAEVSTLISGHLMAPTDFLEALNNSVTGTQTLSADSAINILANLWPSADATFAAQIVGTMIVMMQGGQISPTQVVYDLNGTLNHPLTVDQTIGLMTALSSPNTQLGTALSGAIAADLTQLMQGPVLLGGNPQVSAVDVVVAAIDHAITNQGVDAGNAVTLLAQLANGTMGVQGPLWLMSAAAAQEIVSLIGNNAIGAPSALTYVSWVTANAPDHGIPFMMDIAAHSTQACQVAFGGIIANMVGQGAITAAQAVGYVSGAYAAYAQNPTLQDAVHTSGPSYRLFQPGNVTASQELALLAGMLASVASPGHGNANALIAPIHAELLAAIQTPPYRATDVQVAAALEAVGVNSAVVQAAVNTEIAALENDVGPKMLIDVAHTTGADMGDVGSQLAALIAQGRVSVGEAMGDIVAANQAGNLSNNEALTMITSSLAHAGANGIYVSAATASYANNWLASTASALEALAQHGLSPTAIADAIQGAAGLGPSLIYPDDAVSVLASLGAYPDLRNVAVSHIAGMLANSSFNLSGANIVNDIARCVGSMSMPGVLQASDAVQLLGLIATTNPSPPLYSQIAEGLSTQSVLSADAVATGIEGMVQSGAMTAQQALHFLVPCGGLGSGPVGHALGDLIASNQVSMADFTALIADPSANSQQLAGTGHIDFTDGMLMLVAMTSRTSAAITELAARASADTSGALWGLESLLVNIGQHPMTSGPTPLEVVRTLVTLTLDPIPAQAYGPYSATQIQSDINSIVGANASANANSSLPAAYHITPGDALGALIVMSVDSTPALAQGATAVLNLMLGASSVGGPDGIIAAIGHGITADQAATLLTGIAASQPSLDVGLNFVPQSVVQQVTNTLSHVRGDIAYLIESGQLTGAQALNDVHNACLANNVGAGQELSMLAGIFEQSGGNATVQTAVAHQIDSLIGSGRFNLQQAMDAIAAATYLPNVFQPFPTQAQNTASFIAGGLDAAASAALMALVAANSTDPSAPAVAASELAGMIAGNRIDATQAMSGIDTAVAAGALDAVKAVVFLASTPLSASDSVHATIGGELASLVSNNRISPDQAVNALVTFAHEGPGASALQAGAAVAQLFAHNLLNLATVVNDIHAAAANSQLTPDQAVAMLAGLSAGGSTTAGAIAQEITWQIQHGETVNAALDTLLSTAEHGSPLMRVGVGEVISSLCALGTIQPTQAIAAIDTEFNSHMITAGAATSMLLNIATGADTPTAVAVGIELGRIVQDPTAVSILLASLATTNLSQDQTTLLLAAAIGNAPAGSTALTPLASVIVGMINSGPITMTQVLADIDAAVGSGALTGSQALVALAHLEEAAPNTMRMQVVNEAVALVSNGRISATDAAQALLTAAHGGSVAQQSLSGGILAVLAQNNLLTNQQVVDAVNNATTLSGSEALGVLMGMSVNGNAAAQAAAGFGILSLVDHNRVDATGVISFLDNEARTGMITMPHAIDTLVAIMGATITNADLQGTTFYAQIPAEIVALTTSATFAQWNSQTSLTEVLVQCAAGSMGMAEAVGRVFTALFYADVQTHNTLLDSGPRLDTTLATAVTANTLSADQAMMIAIVSQASGNAVVLPGLISSGVVSVDAALHFLVTQAVRIGDSGSYAPSAFSGTQGSWTERDLMVPMLEAMHSLISNSGLIGMAAAVNDIVAETTQAHDITPLQAAQLLANLAGRVGGADALTAAGGIATLVSQGQLDNVSAMQSIGWMMGTNLDPSLAHLMYASFALNADPTVQQIAFMAFANDSSSQLAAAFHAITTSPLFSHDQALSLIATLAAGISQQPGYGGATWMQGVLAAEIVTMVTSHQITADHAVSMLATMAATSSFHLGALGVELNALIAANAITFGQVVNDLTHSALNVDQVVRALVGLMAANSAMDTPCLVQLESMVSSGAITIVQMMTDIGAAPPDTALRLLVRCGGDDTPGIEDAAAAELASLAAQASDFSVFNMNNVYFYTRAHLDPLHAFGFIISVAAHGGDDLKNAVDRQLRWDTGVNLSAITGYLTAFVSTHTLPAVVQYYFGQELGKLIDHPPVSDTVQTAAQSVTGILDQGIVGTVTQQYLATQANRTSDSAAAAALLPKIIPADTAAMLLLGLTNTTHNSEAQATVNTDLKLNSSGVDAQFLINVAQVMGPQQALTQFVTIVQNGWANTALVGKQIADMLASGSITAAQVTAALAPLDANHQLALVTDILANNEAHASALTSQFATLTLIAWGVAPTSQVYTAMHDALQQVVPDFVGLVRGTTTATQAINDIKGLATQHGVAPDLLLLALFQSAAQDSLAVSNLAGTNAALTAVGHELYTHLADGSAAQTIANMVLSGALTETHATDLILQIATSATVPPSEIQQEVASGNMSVWYASAHFPGWESNEETQNFIAANAAGMMRVDVHIAQDSAALIAGTMTGDQAVADILAAGGQSEYAKELGLLALSQAASGAHLSSDVLLPINHALTERLTDGTAEFTLVQMSSMGWIAPQAAIDMLLAEVTQASIGVDPDAAALLQCMALAQLDLDASGQIDATIVSQATAAANSGETFANKVNVQATTIDMQIHSSLYQGVELRQGFSSSAIENLIETTSADKILMGLGALQISQSDSVSLAAGLTLAQHVTNVLATQMAAHNADGSAASSADSSFINSLPPDMQKIMGYAETAGNYFMLGVGYAQQGLSKLEQVYAPAGEIATLSSNPGSVQTWINLGVDVAVGGIPGKGLFNLFGAGLPGWTGGIQGMVLEEALGSTAAAGFGVVNIGSHIAVAILEIPYIQSHMHDDGITLGVMETLANTCSLVTGMISGTVHTIVNTEETIAVEAFNVFKDACTHQNAAADAEALGKTIFQNMTGLNFDDVESLGKDTGSFFSDLVHGDFGDLGSDAKAMGEDLWKAISDNPMMQMAWGVLQQYGDSMSFLIPNFPSLDQLPTTPPHTTVIGVDPFSPNFARHN